MPPRSNAPQAGRGRPGGRNPPGGQVGRGTGRGGTNVGSPSIAAHVATVGVKRPDFGNAGRPLAIHVNSYVASIPDATIYHYDAIDPATLPARMNMELIKVLQHETAPDVFRNPVVYDGRKNIFSPELLDLGPHHSREFHVTLARRNGGNGGNGGHTQAKGSGGPPPRPPKIYKIKLTKVAEINPEVLRRFIEGNQSHSNEVITAITALNVVIRMEPNLQYPFNVRSFFTEDEKRQIGGGIELWRGYFQSVRPAVGRMLINVDIATGMMYKPGPLISLCLDFLGQANNPRLLSPRDGFPDRERIRLQRFLSGLRVTTSTSDKKRVIKGLSRAGAADLTFTMHGGQTLTVSQYFQSQVNRPLQFPNIVCVEVGNGALLPLEICDVPKGQIMRKQIPPDRTKDVLEFATKKPQERLNIIRRGIDILQYGQSDYIRKFGMSIETAAGPLPVQARVLQAPPLKYGPGSKQLTVNPRDGAWNMVDKKFFKPVEIQRWVLVIYEGQRRFPETDAREMAKGFVAGCNSVGIAVRNPEPVLKYENGQGIIANQLKAAGGECRDRYGGPPNLIVVVLPDNNNEQIYTAVKHFGDFVVGVATQCLKASKCKRAKLQYWANVTLKVNVKMGGINLIPDPQAVSTLTDPSNPTIVMGADVIHPAPGAEGRPSFTALVGNVDSDTAKYIATSRVQTGRQEIINDLQEMCKHILTMYMGYRRVQEKKANPAPSRIIFYRDGVSEGQFQQVLDLELPLIQKACEELKIRPKITLIVVGKRHHIRFFPQTPQQADRSGNCPAGTVVDRDIAHPTEFDFYMQSHAGLLGTSRPAHYSVLYDESGFRSDALQSLSFALCHVYARSTRSVSIPAPVYYADIVCSRAKTHFDPQGSIDLSDSATQATEGQGGTLEAYKAGYRKLHDNQQRLMYFS